MYRPSPSIFNLNISSLHFYPVFPHSLSLAVPQLATVILYSVYTGSPSFLKFSSVFPVYACVRTKVSLFSTSELYWQQRGFFFQFEVLLNIEVVSTLVIGAFKQIYRMYVNSCGTVITNYTVSTLCWPHIQHVSFFCFLKENSTALSCCSICSLFRLPASLSCLLSKDFRLHNFQSEGHQLGANSNRKQHQNHLFGFFFFFLEMWKENGFDSKNYKALENNHCGGMPRVDKWRDRNVSTTSAICFLCCEFSLLCPHCSALFPCFLHYISPFTLFFSLHCISPHMLSSLLSFLSLCRPPSLTGPAFSVKFYLWDVRGLRKLGVSWVS